MRGGDDVERVFKRAVRIVIGGEGVGMENDDLIDGAEENSCQVL
jgi:hypothetical protein